MSMPLVFLTKYLPGLCQGRLTLNKGKRMNVLKAKTNPKPNTTSGHNEPEPERPEGHLLRRASSFQAYTAAAATNTGHQSLGLSRTTEIYISIRLAKMLSGSAMLTLKLCWKNLTRLPLASVHSLPFASQSPNQIGWDVLPAGNKQDLEQKNQVLALFP